MPPKPAPPSMAPPSKPRDSDDEDDFASPETQLPSLEASSLNQPASGARRPSAAPERKPPSSDPGGVKLPPVSSSSRPSIVAGSKGAPPPAAPWVPFSQRRSYSPQEHEAAVRIQVLARRVEALDRCREICRARLDCVFDIKSNSYFYFDKVRGTSDWRKPKILGSQPADMKAVWGATQIQKIYRRKLARRHLGDVTKQWYDKVYDPDTKKFYYVRKMDNTTRWDKPPFLGAGDDAALALDSLRMVERDEEIAKLKAELKEKERIIKITEKARYAELDDKLRNERLLEAKEAPRGKQMDEWTLAEVVAWFDSLGFQEYEEALIKHKVDGLLLLNMEEQDWQELGVTSRLHARKIEVNMKKYQLRYKNRMDKMKAEAGEESDDTDDSGLSDLSISSDPSDLIDEMLALEDMEGEDAEEKSDDEDAGDRPPTEEEVLEKKRDEENVSIEVIYPGDGKTHPKNGDVVQLHYTMTLAGGKVVESSRKMRHRPFEFVVGVGQVIKGWDVAIKKFSFGERSKVVVKAKYAYGAKGFPPSVPPNSDLTFDLELIKWWKRPVWIKPLVQQPGLSQKPYTKEEEQASGNVAYGDAAKVETGEKKVKEDEFDSDDDN